MCPSFAKLLLPVLGLYLLSSCNSGKNNGNNPPIKLGDSATIVTEADPQYLQDLVTDITPITPPAEKEDTATKAPEPATAPQQNITSKTPEKVAPPASTSVQGLNIPFKEITVSIPGLNAKGYRNQNPVKPNGATYQYVSGTINGCHINISGAASVKVSQRYQTVIIIKNNNSVLPLESLTNMTDWVPLMGHNNAYTVSGLALNSLEPDDISPSKLKRAIEKAARKHRQSREHTQEWLRSVSRIRNTVTRPLAVVLRSVIWKIDGKGKDGRAFSKQIRIDIDTPNQ